jgi:hypothetical protein
VTAAAASRFKSRDPNPGTMRDTEVEQFVQATVPVVEQALTPERVVEFEGSFDVLAVEPDDDATLVTAGARGLQLVLRFEAGERSLRYEQEGQAGPFDEMWTRLTWTPENEGTRVTATSAVSLGLPASALTDRVAVWKRRGELRRLLSRLAADLG